MVLKFRWIAILEFLIIILLLTLLVYRPWSETANNSNVEGLLSPRVYAELLEPKSFLIVKFTPLREKILAFANDNSLNASVYIKNLRNGASMGIRENTGYFPASLTKVPLAILIMEKIEKGELTLDKRLPILDSDRSGSSGSLYKTDKKELTVRELLAELLKESDNTAFNVLSHYAENNNMDLIMDYFDIDVFPNQDYRSQQQKHELLVSTRKMGNIFSSLYFSTLLEPKDSEYLLNLMIHTNFDIEKAADIPSNAIISQKYGAYYANNTKLFHSCGILYIDQSRIFYCIMTKDSSEPEAAKFVGFVVNQTYNYVLNERERLDFYKKEGTFK